MEKWKRHKIKINEKSNLEEISLKNGKFFDKKHKEIKPIQIGPGIFFLRYSSSEVEKKLDELKTEKKEYNEVNAYLAGDKQTYILSVIGACQRTEAVVNFYKI